MSRSMRKFFSETGGENTEHGGNLSWPGTPDGYPFRGDVPDLKQHESVDIPTALDYHSELFILNDPEHKQRFDMINDRIVNGWYMQRKRIDRWDNNQGGLVVWLEWVQIYGETPKQKHPGISNDQSINSQQKSQ